MAPNDDLLINLDATGQAELVRNRKISATGLLAATLDRIERVNPKVNAIASLNKVGAEQIASNMGTSGVFAGVPTLVKDVLSYPGLPLGFGSQLFEGAPAMAGSDYTDALDESGLVVLGKSTTSEFGLLGTTETLAKGATRNPWGLTRTSGGSSGGAVAAVAAGLVPVAHASDGGGSIRGPASLCGVFGFKPSRDRTASIGMPPEAPLARLVADHCVSRSVRDSYNWLRATERKNYGNKLSVLNLHTSLPRLRIGVFQEPLDLNPVSSDVRAAIWQTIALCEELGHEVIPISTPSIDVLATSQAYYTLTGATLAGLFEQAKVMMGETLNEELFEPYTQVVIARGRQCSPDAIGQALGTISASAEIAENAMQDLDVLLSPTVPYSAFPLGEISGCTSVAELDEFIVRIAGYTVIASLAGWPAMSVPLHWSDENLPIGSHFSARIGRDELLFHLAFELERAAPWRSKQVQLMKSL